MIALSNTFYYIRVPHAWSLCALGSSSPIRAQRAKSNGYEYDKKKSAALSLNKRQLSTEVMVLAHVIVVAYFMM